MAVITRPSQDVIDKVHEVIDSPVHEDMQGATTYYSEDGSEALILIDMGAQVKTLLYNVYQDGPFVFATQTAVGSFEEV